MATGIQGPQGFKGPRGIQGATGWGAIGNDTGPTGPMGPMGMFTSVSNITSTLTLSMNTVSSLYFLTVSAMTLTNGGSMSAGGFWVFSNQSSAPCVITLSGMTINGSSSTYTVSVGQSFTLSFNSGIDFRTV
jgi:hypothetical protein